jgi:hypothetical protein
MFKRRAIIAIAISLMLTFGAPLQARPRGKNAGKSSAKPATRKTKPADEPTAAPYLSGEAKVKVRGEQHPVIRIGMAPSGITIIEFPASDRFFAVHPPENGDWVQVEKSPSLTTDHHLVLRAGKDLTNAPGPAASVSVQMRSGLIVTIWVYPAKMVVQQTYRCVISYDRDEIVTARRNAGLAVNLGEGADDSSASKIAQKPGEEKLEKGASDNDSAQTVAPEAAEKAPITKPPAPAPAAAASASADTAPALPAVIAYVERADEKKPGKPGDRKLRARDLLDRAVAKPKQFKNWSTPQHGLTVSAQAQDLDEQTRIAIVAVRNVQREPFRVLPGHPDLFIETLDTREKTFQISPVRKLHTDSTTTSSIIPAGATVYYAVVYAAPILGVKQRLRVTVGQTNAADDPAAAGLTARQ